jgi:hypothetical protein
LRPLRFLSGATGPICLWKIAVFSPHEGEDQPVSEVAQQMAEPVVVTIPHKLGKQEATRRLQEGFKNVRSTFGEKFVVMKDNWKGDHLDFSASLFGQNTTGMLDVAEDHVRLEVQLPWMLAMFANKAKALVKKQGQLMLEKPTKPTTTRT